MVLGSNSYIMVINPTLMS